MLRVISEGFSETHVGKKKSFDVKRKNKTKPKKLCHLDPGYQSRQGRQERESSGTGLDLKGREKKENGRRS